MAKRTYEFRKENRGWLMSAEEQRNNYTEAATTAPCTNSASCSYIVHSVWAQDHVHCNGFITW